MRPTAEDAMFAVQAATHARQGCANRTVRGLTAASNRERLGGVLRDGRVAVAAAAFTVAVVGSCQCQDLVSHTKVACVHNSDCIDGYYCDATRTCIPGTPPDGGVPDASADSGPVVTDGGFDAGPVCSPG